MSTTVLPTLARFAAELSDTIEKLYDKYNAADSAFYEIYEPSIQLYTVDGLTAKFYEEGIEFYPEEPKPLVESKTFTGETLGDIAEVLREMKAAGMTRESVVYALDRVYWETPSDG